MGAKDSNPTVKLSIEERVLRHQSVLIALSVVLMSLVSCSPISDATVEPTPDAEIEIGRSATPVSSQPTATPSVSSAEVSLSQHLRFGNLTTEDGLSNDAIWGIAQDHHGFMWFATYAGLNRYDGSSFKIYRHNPDRCLLPVIRC